MADSSLGVLVAGGFRQGAGGASRRAKRVQGDMGIGEVSKLLAEKFHGDIPQNLSAGRAGDGDRMAAKAQADEVYGVLAEEVVAHAHVGEAPPWEGVGCGWWYLHRCLPLLRLHVRVEKRGMYMPRSAEGVKRGGKPQWGGVSPTRQGERSE